MERGVIWIDRDEALAEFASALGDGPIGLDTEADSLHRYREKVCLLQISDDRGDALIDALALPDLDPLREILEDPARRKVLHGADYDVRMLRRDHGIALAGIFDTMIAARIVGENPFGLASLLERHFGVRLDKRHQRADWARRPLPAEMAAYAAADTRHLLALAALLEGRLKSLDRETWAAEEFRRIEVVRFDASPESDPWRRIRGAGGLDRRGLAALRAAWTWREERARSLDRPPFRVASTEVLLEIARRRPATFEALSGIPGGPRSWREGRGGAVSLLAMLAPVEDLPDTDLPESVRSARPVRDPAFEKRVARFKSRRDEIARRLSIEPPVLASRAALEELQRALDEGRDPAAVPEIRTWQLEVLGI